MDLNPAQLDTLVTIVEAGSFEAAADRLHVTPSAVSQRIRALEASAGQVLVSRGTPCRATPHGERLVQLGRQTRLLYDEARQALGTIGSVELPVVVNADSLGTWFREVLAEAADWPGTALHLNVEDEAHSQELLRRGDVLAAVTSDPATVQGCTAEPLGVMRYVPAAAPEFADRWRGDRGDRGDRGGGGERGEGEPDWAAMPVMIFNDKDRLQHDQLRRRGVTGLPAVVHRIPATSDFYAAIRLGLGWGMVPEPQARADLASGALTRLSADVVDVPLHWQRWRLDSPRLATLSEAVRRAARRCLLPP
jgi:LysR family transcriptional regulator, chromosome initiation inhibitor